MIRRHDQNCTNDACSYSHNHRKTVLRAEHAENVYPECSEAVLGIRYFPENKADGLVDLVKKYMPRGYRCEAKVLVNTPPYIVRFQQGSTRR